MSDENKSGTAALVGLGVIGLATLASHFFGKSEAFGAAKTNPYWGRGGSKKGYPTPRGDESYPPYAEHLATAPIEYEPGYGRGVKRGDSPSPMPAADRWKLWKAMGLLPQIVPQGGVGWEEWRARSSPLDIPTPSPLPGHVKFGALSNGKPYTVRGDGSFPSDMLRYDDATFASPEDAVKASSSREERSVNLVLTHRSHYKKNRTPTADRWASFGWEVV